MHPRLPIDAGWGDLASAAVAVALAGGRARRAARVEALFSPAGDAFAALSARSGFDLYLRALALPAGSEVLVSGLTIPHMPQILAAHGLVPVPFALEPATLAPPPGELERRAGPRARAILFAHLFGERAELAPLFSLARRRGLLVWEDCAQAWSGDAWRGSSEADLALFSFGLIKTGTAVQGGLLRVRDAALLARMRELGSAWPAQRRADFLRRVARAALLVALGRPSLFGAFARRCARSGRDIDEVLHAATRGFPGPDFLERLRREPSAPLLALLERRLRRPRASLAARRRELGEWLLAQLGPESRAFGRLAPERHHWVFAVESDEPAQLVRALRAAGFDATARSSLVPVERAGGPPPDAADARADAVATGACRRMLERLVYVPLATRASSAERAELARILREDARVVALAPRAAPVPALPAPSAQPPGG